MSTRPVPKLDPERLKKERRDVDLGNEETQHDDINREAGKADPDAPLRRPTTGMTPPPR
jgi:hypothetical protein